MPKSIITINMSDKNMTKSIKWDVKATAVFTQYEIDRELGIEKDDANENVKSIDELR